MLDDSLSELVIATLVALNDVHHELHHVILNVPLLLLHCIDFLHATLYLPHDELTSVSIYQNYPLIDQELLRFELDLDGFQHLDGLDNHLESGFWHGCVILLKQKQVHLEAALDLCGQLDAISDLVRSNLQEILVLQHHIRVFQTV